jgi:hypothetical protein
MSALPIQLRHEGKGGTTSGVADQLSDFTGQGKEGDRTFILATIEQLAAHLGSK